MSAGVETWQLSLLKVRLVQLKQSGRRGEAPIATISSDAQGGDSRKSENDKPPQKKNPQPTVYNSGLTQTAFVPGDVSKYGPYDPNTLSLPWERGLRGRLFRPAQLDWQSHELPPGRRALAHER